MKHRLITIRMTNSKKVPCLFLWSTKDCWKCLQYFRLRQDWTPYFWCFNSLKVVFYKNLRKIRSRKQPWVWLNSTMNAGLSPIFWGFEEKLFEKFPYSFVEPFWKFVFDMWGNFSGHSTRVNGISINLEIYKWKINWLKQTIVHSSAVAVAGQ